MKLCLVTSTVVATIKHPAYIGQKLLSYQPLDSTSTPQDAELLTVDRIQTAPIDQAVMAVPTNYQAVPLSLWP